MENYFRMGEQFQEVKLKFFHPLFQVWNFENHNLHRGRVERKKKLKFILTR